jgi:hypothetical protein
MEGFSWPKPPTWLCHLQRGSCRVDVCIVGVRRLRSSSALQQQFSCSDGTREVLKEMIFLKKHALTPAIFCRPLRVLEKKWNLELLATNNRGDFEYMLRLQHPSSLNAIPYAKMYEAKGCNAEPRGRVNVQRKRNRRLHVLKCQNVEVLSCGC